MSYSAHMRDVRDDRLPLRHRISHLRSCSNHMAQKFHVHRSIILEKIQIACPYSDEDLPTIEAVLRAADLLDKMKHHGLHSV